MLLLCWQSSCAGCSAGPSSLAWCMSDNHTPVHAMHHHSIADQLKPIVVWHRHAVSYSARDAAGFGPGVWLWSVALVYQQQPSLEC